MDIQKYLNEKSLLIEKKLSELVPLRDVSYQELFQAARYALLGGGKRLRPILTLATVETFGGSEEAALSPACALEMIHTYSMIHDDLPCMDDDDFRRGKPSLHRAFNEGSAVLTGDYLLTYAFEVITQAPKITNDQKIQLIELLAKSSGSEGMIGGQVMDLEAENKNIELDTLQQIHHQKTGAMLTASLLFGAILSQTTPQEKEILQNFGIKIGIAYQIIDDILDVTASQKKHGKDISSDVINQKSTYVTLIGIETSKRLANEFLTKAIADIKNLNKETTILENLAKCLINRDN